jgi:hypothetical protein
MILNSLRPHSSRDLLETRGGGWTLKRSECALWEEGEKEGEERSFEIYHLPMK